MNAPEKLALDTQTITVPFTSNVEQDDDLVGSVVSFFKILPTQAQGDWATNIVNTSTGVASEAPPLLFSFESLVSTTQIQRELEPHQKVTLIVDLPKNEKEYENELWQFYGKGIVFINEPSSSELRVQTEVKNQGQRLVITIDNVANDLEVTELAFRYVASCINTSAGASELKIYYSQDPKVAIDRPDV